MGQAVVPWESQERCSLYLPHPHLPIVHSICGILSTVFSLCSHSYLCAFSCGCLVFLWVSTIKPFVLRHHCFNFLCITLFLSVIPLYLLSLPIMRYTYTYLSTAFVVRHLLVFLFTFLFSLSLRFGYANRSSLWEEFPPTMLYMPIKLCISLPFKHAMFATLLLVQILSISLKFTH